MRRLALVAGMVGAWAGAGVVDAQEPAVAPTWRTPAEALTRAARSQKPVLLFVYGRSYNSST